eukprot:TRINITY_DN3428_c0_g1_i1.p1 TRINITY_DN3428_c0_g1~~TRINITY_DN3428_c0_g1_i1.p1  ORF type:complete len:103 (-),score=6.19 TRINITY_DN3428_c0_g1_i1:246-554(-)
MKSFLKTEILIMTSFRNISCILRHLVLLFVLSTHFFHIFVCTYQHFFATREKNFEVTKFAWCEFTCFLFYDFCTNRCDNNCDVQPAAKPREALKYAYNYLTF